MSTIARFVTEEEIERLEKVVEEKDDVTLLWMLRCVVSRDDNAPLFGGQSEIGGVLTRLLVSQVLERWVPSDIVVASMDAFEDENWHGSDD